MPARPPRPPARRALLAALLATALAWPARAQDQGTAARVNGVEISAERLRLYFEEFLGERGRNLAAIRSPSAFKELKRQALDQLIEQELLWQEARRRKRVAPDQEVDAAVRKFAAQFPDERRRQAALERGGFTDESYRAWVREQLSISRLVEKEIVPTVKVTREDARDFYEANGHLFDQPAEARVRHILARLAPGASEADKAAARARLEVLRDQARAGADFAALARAGSDDGSASSGGDLGWFGKGTVTPTLERAAFEVPVGMVSEVFETGDGLHILRVEERREEARTPFKEAEPSIRERLLQQRRREAVSARARKLRQAGTIEVLIPLG